MMGKQYNYHNHVSVTYDTFALGNCRIYCNFLNPNANYLAIALIADNTMVDL